MQKVVQQIRQVAEVLLRYPWPGNVRELRNVIRRAMLLASDVIEPGDLAFLSVGASPSVTLRGELAPGHASLREIAGAAVAEAEQEAIRRALEITMGNKSEAARLLRTHGCNWKCESNSGQRRLNGGTFADSPRGFRLDKSFRIV